MTINGKWWPLVALVAMALACSDSDDGGGPPPGMMDGDEEVVVSVETVDVERGEFRVTADYAGEVRSDQMTEVAPEVPGRLVSLRAHIGDTVAEGEVLAEVDDSSLRQTVRELEAGVAVAEANLEEAQVHRENVESELNRRKPLVDREMVSEREIEELEASTRSAEQQVAVAESRLEESRARLQTAREDLDNTEVRAPFDGKIGMRHVDRGTYVGPERPIFTLVDDGQLYLTVRIPERQAANVDRDTPATIRLGALGNMELTGEIRRIAPAIDAATRSMRVDVDIDTGDDLRLLPGMYGRLNLELGYVDDALTIDNQTIRHKTDGTPYVWRIEDGKAHRQTFSSLGLQGRERTQILEGLDEGDRVVLRGHDQLDEDGLRIRDLEASDDIDEPMPQAPEEL